MKLSELTGILSRHPESSIRIFLPGGREIRADFHVTEVGHVAKHFIDCGGTMHSRETWVLQVWLAKNDAEHRIKAGKLASILGLAKSLLPSGDLDVEVEYEDAVVSQYPISSFETGPSELRFKLESKHTDCLAREACGLEIGCC